MADSQLVVSEAAPGVRPTQGGFLAGTGLIAALGLGASSSRQRSVLWSSEYRIGPANLAGLVMVVPGSAHWAVPGCHRLIRHGQATLAADCEDAVALLAPVGRGPDLPERGEQCPWTCRTSIAHGAGGDAGTMPGHRVRVGEHLRQPVPDVVGAPTELGAARIGVQASRRIAGGSGDPSSTS